MKYHYSSLRVYLTAHDLAKDVFKFVLTLESQHKYDLGSQLKRAALSVALNIVEGSGRKSASQKEFRRFLLIAYGSLCEVEYLLHFYLEQQLMTPEIYAELEEKRSLCGAQLWKLIQSQK